MAKRGRTQQEAEVPISAMIDIVFLLIIFFVVTASIDKDIQDDKVTLANAPHGKPLTKKNPLQITINIREKGEINIGGMRVNERKLLEFLNNVADRWGKDVPVVIRGDRETQHYYIQKVTEAVKKTNRLYRVKMVAEISSRNKDKMVKQK